MRAIILAAGAGRRLGLDLPKSMIEVAGRSILLRQIDAFASAGVDDFVVVVGYQRERIVEHLAHVPGRLTFVHNERFAETNTVYSLYLARRCIPGGFFYANADVVFDARLVRRLTDPTVPVSEPGAEATGIAPPEPGAEATGITPSEPGAAPSRRSPEAKPEAGRVVLSEPGAEATGPSSPSFGVRPGEFSISAFAPANLRFRRFSISSLAVQVGRCGEEEVKVIVRDGRIVRIGKKLDPADCLGEFVGVAWFGSDLAPAFVSALEACVEKENAVTDYFERAVDRLCDDWPLIPADVSHLPCIEIDFPEDLARARDVILPRLKP